MDFKKRTRIIGVLFFLVALILVYTDSFVGIFVSFYALPTFGYLLPRLIDFLFYSGLILMTLSTIYKPK